MQDQYILQNVKVVVIYCLYLNPLCSSCTAIVITAPCKCCPQTVRYSWRPSPCGWILSLQGNSCPDRSAERTPATGEAEMAEPAPRGCNTAKYYTHEVCMLSSLSCRQVYLAMLITLLLLKACNVWCIRCMFRAINNSQTSVMFLKWPIKSHFARTLIPL